MVSVEDLKKIKRALKKVQQAQKRIRNTLDKKQFKGYVYIPDPVELERAFQEKRLKKRLAKQKTAVKIKGYN